MRNKIMTKALAVALSASMAFSLSSAMSLSTAMAATKTAPAFVHDAKFTVVAGGVAKPFKLNKKTRKAGWKIVGTPKVTNTDKATASVTDSKLSVIIIPAESYEFAEGVKKVQTRVKVKVRKNNKKSTQKTLKRKVVLKNPNATEEAAKIKIESAVQTTPTEAVVTLAGEATNDVTIDTFKIVEGEKEYQATAVTLSEDKKSIIVSYPFAESTETVTYTYTFSDANLEGTASITTGSYAVASIELKDQEIQAGALRPVAFKLLTADGVDVTKYGTYLADVIVEFDGTYTEAVTIPSNPEINFNAVGDKAKIKITYDTDKIVAEATLTAIAPVATKAEARFATFDADANKNNYSRIFKWWRDDQNASSVELYSDQDPVVYFFYARATDSSKALGYYAVEYSDVEVKSSNEDVVTVEYDLDSEASKYVTLTITPQAVGSATISVVGIEKLDNGTELKSDVFKLPIKVMEFNNNIKSVSTSVTTISMSNADEDYGIYSSDFRIESDNSNGVPVDASYTIEVLNNKGEAPDNGPLIYYGDAWDDKDKIEVGLATKLENVDSEKRKTGDDRPKICVFARNADAGTYRIKITAEGNSGSNSATLSKTINVKVTDVVEKIYNAKDLSKLGLQFKVGGNSALKLDENWGETVGDYSLNAYISNSFVGRVKYSNAVSSNVIGEYPNNWNFALALANDIDEYYAYVFKGATYYPLGLNDWTEDDGVYDYTFTVNRFYGLPKFSEAYGYDELYGTVEANFVTDPWNILNAGALGKVEIPEDDVYTDPLKDVLVDDCGFKKYSVGNYDVYVGFDDEGYACGYSEALAGHYNVSYVPEAPNTNVVFDLASKKTYDKKDITANGIITTNVWGSVSANNIALTSDRVSAGSFSITMVDKYYPLYFGANNAKNEGIAGTGTYSVAFYREPLGLKGSTTGNKAVASLNINVSQNVTMPEKIDYNTSSSVDAPYAVTPIDLTSEAGSSVFYSAGRSAANAKAKRDDAGFENNYTDAKAVAKKYGYDFSASRWFDNTGVRVWNGIGEGDTVYAIAVTNWMPGRYYIRTNWDGGEWNGALICCVFESTKRITE